jgi:hypothetical protein
MKILITSFVRTLAKSIAPQMKPTILNTTQIIMTQQCVMCSYCCNWQQF